MMSIEDVQRAIVDTATARGGDPKLALATADVESGFDVTAVGDRGSPYPSYGPFQERVRIGRGGLEQPDPDPARQTSRFFDDVFAFFGAGGRGTPGQIAAAVQRPADPVGYARKVDERYGTEGIGFGGTPAPTAPSEPCPPGYYRNAAGQCLSAAASIIISKRPTPGALPDDTPGASIQRPGASLTGVTTPEPFDPFGLGGVGGALDRLRTDLAKGTKELIVVGAVIGAAALLTWGGVKKVVD